MNTSIQMLDLTRLALQSAVQSGDWARVADLDLQCRRHVNDAMLASDLDQVQLRESFSKLLALYATMIEQCRAKRDDLGDELTAVRRATQGAKVYQLFG